MPRNNDEWIFGRTKKTSDDGGCYGINNNGPCELTFCNSCSNCPQCDNSNWICKQGSCPNSKKNPRYSKKIKVNIFTQNNGDVNIFYKNGNVRIKLWDNIGMEKYEIQVPYKSETEICVIDEHYGDWTNNYMLKGYCNESIYKCDKNDKCKIHSVENYKYGTMGNYGQYDNSSDDWHVVTKYVYVNDSKPTPTPTPTSYYLTSSDNSTFDNYTRKNGSSYPYIKNNFDKCNDPKNCSNRYCLGQCYTGQLMYFDCKTNQNLYTYCPGNKPIYQFINEDFK